MRIHLVILAVAVAVGFASTGLTAQPLGADIFTGHATGQIVRSTPNGPVTLLPGSFGFFINGLTMDTDNRTLVALDSLQVPTAVVRIDPVAAAILGTVHAGAPFTREQSYIDIDDDGDYLVADGSSSIGNHLFKVNRVTGAVSTVLTDPLGYFWAFCEDKSTGNYLIGDVGSRMAILTFDRNTLVVTSITAVTVSITAMMRDPHRLTVYCAGARFLTFNPRTFATSTFGPSLGRTAANAGGIDRAPAANGGLIYGGLTNGDLIQLDRQGNVLGTVASAGRSCLSFIFDKSRNLGPELINAPNDRNIRVSFPGDANKPYTLALGLSGYQPGVNFPGGRVVPLNTDSLTALTLNGLIPQLLSNNIGVLDGNGEAVVRFNLNALGGQVKNVRVWAAAVTLDPQAPSGISQISAPLLIVL